MIAVWASLWGVRCEVWGVRWEPQTDSPGHWNNNKIDVGFCKRLFRSLTVWQWRSIGINLNFRTQHYFITFQSLGPRIRPCQWDDWQIKTQTDSRSLHLTNLFFFLFSALLRNCSERQYNAVFYLTKYTTDRFLLYTHRTITHLSVQGRIF